MAIDTKKRAIQKAGLFDNLFCFADNLCAIKHQL